VSDPPVFPRSRPRVDAHLHLSQWWPDIRRTGYRPDLAYSVGGLLAEMDRNRLDYALAIQLFQAPSELTALEEGRSLYASSGGRLLPVATVDPTKGSESVSAVLSQLEKEATLFGIKLFPGYLSFYPSDPRLEPVYEFAHRRRIPVLFHQGDTLDGRGLLKFARPLDVDEVAGRFREVRFVLCHLGNPWIAEAAGVLYKNSNVFADTSGLLPPPTTPYFTAATERAREEIQGAIVATGAPERFLYGSDWPLESLELAVDLIESLRLRAEDIAGVLGANAVRLFRIPVPTSVG
jgi:uncharacterized protein